MKQVMVLLQFQRATKRTGSVLGSTRDAVYLLIFLQQNGFAQNILEYIALIHVFESADPDIWDEFLRGNFMVNTNSILPFTRVGVDLAMEHINKVTKDQAD